MLAKLERSEVTAKDTPSMYKDASTRCENLLWPTVHVDLSVLAERMPFCAASVSSFKQTGSTTEIIFMRF